MLFASHKCTRIKYLQIRKYTGTKMILLPLDSFNIVLMWETLVVWIGNRYHRIVNSIAFYPALIGAAFLLLSYISIAYDFSEAGKAFKAQLHWLSLKDASTARSIITAIVAGIISLTVFSFSMVMIVLSQTASQMSNRILDKVIGNRFQQIVLGFYIGTTVFALFLLSTIRDIDSGIYIPSISTYFLIVLTIIDIFLFIYFLHYITQSVKYEVIIQRIYEDTKKNMKKVCSLKTTSPNTIEATGENVIEAGKAGIYEGFNKKALVNTLRERNCRLNVLITPGTFVFKDTHVAETTQSLEENDYEEIQGAFYINNSETIEKNYSYGFRQLMEVAVKALSPGINDPGTAVQALRALSKLLAFRIDNQPQNAVSDKKKEIRIVTTERDVSNLVKMSLLPIWDYGAKDRRIQNEFAHLLTHLRRMSEDPTIQALYERSREAISRRQIALP